MTMAKNLKVAVQNDDGSIGFVSAEEFQRRRPRFERRGAEWLISKYKKSGRVTHRAVLETLAVLKRSHEAFGEDSEVSIPFEFLDVIGSLIAGKVKWQREQARQRKEEAQAPQARWRAEADKIRARNPKLKLSDLRVAQIIARQLGGNADYIRRKIARK